MNKNDFEIVYPSEVSLGKERNGFTIHLTKNLKKKGRLKGLIENEANGRSYTYIEDGDSINLLIYNSLTISGFSTRKLLPVTELCRTDYAIKSKESISSDKEMYIYVFLQERVVVSVYANKITSYICLGRGADLDKFLTLVAQTERSSEIDGYTNRMILDELADSLSGKKDMTSMDVISKKINDSQLIDNPEFVSGTEMFLKGFGQKILNVFSSTNIILLVSVPLLITGSYQQYISLTEVQAKNTQIEKKLSLLSAQLSTGSSSTSVKDEEVYVNINPEQVTKIEDFILEQLKEVKINNISSEEPTQEDLDKIAEDNMPAPNFYCKVQIKEKDRVTCLYQGASITIEKQYKKFGSNQVKYLSKTGEFKLKTPNGKTSLTTLEMSNRGF